MQTKWHFEISNLTELEATERQWRNLEKKADCSFFQSWCWIGTWLEKIQSHFDPILFRLIYCDEVVALAVAVPRRTLRRKCVFSRGLFFGATGDDYYDSITVEHSGPLVKSGMQLEASVQIVRGLLSHRIEWDELYLPGLDSATQQVWKNVASRQKLMFREQDRKPFFTVDLTAIRTFDDYLASLSSNSRQQIRRAIRGYERDGPIDVAEAASEDEARAFLSGLRRLHQNYWRERGQRGAFGSKFQHDFHNLLIKRTFSSGRLQMLRFRAGDAEIGYLYNFTWRGAVYSYQSGFAYSKNDSRLKPGLVCHSLAVDWNQRKRMSVYDFLAGNSRYKRSLSTEQGDMHWLALQKTRLRFIVENRLAIACRNLLGKVQL